MNPTAPDPYAVLGIPRDASNQQVQRAYRRLAKRHHPDLNPGARTSHEMRRINRAWETLSSPASRAQYDAESALSKPAGFGHWSAPARHASPRRQAWNPAWGSPSTARTYRSPAAGRYDGAGPGWNAVTGSVVAGLLLVVALFSGILPTPLLGILVVVAARSILARFD
jgi:curved DNA-binding protein CbpA